MIPVRPLRRCSVLSLGALGVMLTCGALPVQADVPKAPVNLDFEQGELGRVPNGWFFPVPGQKAGFSAKLSEEKPRAGKRCLLIERTRAAERGGLGNLLQSFDAAPYRGKRVRYKAAVRADVQGFGNQAQLWMRVDRKNDEPGFFDNMSDRPIRDNRWKDYEIVGDVADDAVSITIGIMFFGEGKCWCDNASFRVVGLKGVGDEPARPLAGRGLDNLAAFARLYGYVRYFHPSDQAAAADWDRVALEGVLWCEESRDAADLARKLEEYFKPLAPTLRVFLASEAKPGLPAALLPPKDGSAITVAWLHLGVGAGNPQSIYSSRRVSSQETEFASLGKRLKLPDLPDPGKPLVADLGGGVSCVVPLALHADAEGTLPHAAAVKPQPSKRPEGFLPSGNDRATRLAAVVVAWNVFQHFYPYFDVVKADWPATLRTALRAAATDEGEQAFLGTLRRLVAELHDGHGHVLSRGSTPWSLPPFLWDWVEGQLVITQVAPAGAGRLKPGDVVVKVNCLPAAEALAQVEQMESAATPQYRRHRGLSSLARGPKNSDLRLVIRPPAGAPYTAVVKRTFGFGEVKEPRPDKVGEIKPGIWYVDLDRASDADFAAAVPKLAKAKGIVFDLRGYPRVSTTPIGHLTDKPVTCAQWHIPITLYPDRNKVTYSFSNWNVQPREPRFHAKVAFLTDGRAISYAETYLGIIEHYRLADVVGGPTAGTNGNINPVRLPGGYSVIWTGMRVLKHDGRQHHGIGIQPTVKASRTLRGVRAGEDELLAKGAELVSR
jgi:C-terminal processing protease CtpA/Prc